VQRKLTNRRRIVHGLRILGYPKTALKAHQANCGAGSRPSLKNQRARGGGGWSQSHSRNSPRCTSGRPQAFQKEKATGGDSTFQESGLDGNRCSPIKNNHPTKLHTRQVEPKRERDLRRMWGAVNGEHRGFLTHQDLHQSLSILLRRRKRYEHVGSKGGAGNSFFTKAAKTASQKKNIWEKALAA